MRSAGKAKKLSTPAAETVAAAPVVEAAVTEAATEAGKAPHERFWAAGQLLYQSLQKSDAEARSQLASAFQQQQQNLWQAQLGAQKRAAELRQDYWRTFQQAAGEDRQRVYQEATQRYLGALEEVQADHRKEWEGASAGHQRFVTNLHDVFQTSRLVAFSNYKQACKQAWSELDPDALTCESLASIGQSLLMAAQLMGAQPHGA
jgi:hypothetical protein